MERRALGPVQRLAEVAAVQGEGIDTGEVGEEERRKMSEVVFSNGTGIIGRALAQHDADAVERLQLKIKLTEVMQERDRLRRALGELVREVDWFWYAEHSVQSDRLLSAALEKARAAL